jgi:DNA polymerase elongation subunit (family B)
MFFNMYVLMDRLSYSEYKTMKILHIDLETSPMSAHIWELKQRGWIPADRIIDTSRTLCAAYKWEGEKNVSFMSEWDISEEGAFFMVERLHRLMDEADAVVTYNGNRFDIPTLNKEFVMHGLPPPSPYKSIDLFRTVKSKFRFPSSSLGYVSKALGLGGKADTGGFQLWLDVADGIPKARKAMENYNRQDVVLLEKLYKHLLPWIPNHPNRSHHSGTHCCPSCGGTSLQARGYSMSAIGKRQRYQCNSCGRWSQDTQAIERTPVRNRVVGAN